MEVLAAILTCSLHNDDALVRAIVDNAHDNPYTILTPELEPSLTSDFNPPRTLDAAVAQLDQFTAQGLHPLLGLLQVPIAWASTYGREVRDLFDPCINVAIGTAVLSEFDYECPPSAPRSVPLRPVMAARGPVSRRTCVLQHYADAIRMPELATVVTLSLRYPRSLSPPPSDAPIFPSTHERRRWGSDCLFVPTPSEPATEGPRGSSR